MMSRKFRTDSSGLLLDSFSHDALLEKIFIVEGEVFLDWRASSGRRMRLSLSELNNYRVKDLGPGNFLSDVYVWPIAEVPESYWLIPDSAWGVIFGADYLLVDAKSTVSRLVDSQTGWLVVQIGFSVGGAMAFICKGLSVDEIEIGS